MQKTKTRRRAQQPEKKGDIMRSVKGAVTALVITVAAVLVLAMVVKQTGMSDEVISAVNQIVKVVCIFLAALIATRGQPESAIAAGAMSGAMYIVLGYLSFSLIEGNFGDILLMFADLAMGVIIGMLTGVIFGKLLARPAKPAKRGA